jgi:hypothetical protein
VNMEQWWNDILQGKPKYSEKTYPVPLCPPQIPGLRGERPATNRLSHGTAFCNS